MENVLEQYLVRLQWDANASGFSKFQGTLKEAGRSIDSMVVKSGANLLGWGAAAGGMFLGLGAGLAKLVDGVAMADQSYRLFALRMFTTQAVGRELSITMKALGASLDEITWDPELHARAMQLFKDQEQIVAGMGAGFEENMKRIRDLRFEFQRFGVIAKYGVFQFVSDLFDKLASQFGFMTQGFDKFNDRLITKLPELADKAASTIAWFVKVGESGATYLYDKIKEYIVDLLRLIGVWADDPALAKATGKWGDFGDAIKDVGFILKDFMGDMKDSLNVLMLTMESMAERAAHPLTGGKSKELLDKAETLQAMLSFKWDYKKGQVSRMELAPHSQSDADLQKLRSVWRGGASALEGGSVKKDALNAAVQVSRLTGLPANLIWDQWAFETADFTKMKGRNNFGNIMHGGAFVNYSNLGDFVNEYAKVASREPGIGGAKTFMGWASSMRSGNYWTDPTTVQQYAGGMKRYDPEFQSLAAQVHIDTVNITVPPSQTPQQAVKTVREAMKFNVQKNLAQMGGPYQR